MENCLVTKLKGEVVNSNLPKIGEQNLDVKVSVLKQNTSCNIGIVYGDNGYIILPAGIDYAIDTYNASKFYEPVTLSSFSQSQSDNEKINVPTNGVVLFRGTSLGQDIRVKCTKYNCKGFAVNGVDIEKSALFDIAKYSPDFTKVSLRNLDIETSISEVISLFNNPAEATLFHLENIKCTGNVSDLGVLTGASWITVHGNGITLEGTYEDCIVSLYNHNIGNKSKLEISLTGATFNSALQNKIYATFDNSTITVYASNKTTILGTYNDSTWTYNS